MGFLLVLWLGTWSLIMAQDSAAQSSPKESVKFRLQDLNENQTDGYYLVLDSLRKINQSTDNRNLPGIVWIEVPFIKGSFDPNQVRIRYDKPHAGKGEFFSEVLRIIRGWNYTVIPVDSGSLLYNVSTEGHIEINVENLGMTKIEDTLAMVHQKGFKRDKISLTLSQAQKESESMGWLAHQIDKLGISYFIVFVLLIMAALFATVITWRDSVKRVFLNFKNNKSETSGSSSGNSVEFRDELEKLWLNNLLCLVGTVRCLDVSNPDLGNEKKEFIDNVIVELEKGAIEVADQVRIGGFFDKYKEFEKYKPTIDYHELGKRIKTLNSQINVNKDEYVDRGLIDKIRQVIWDDYSRKIIDSVKLILADKRISVRESKIWIGGLENHLNNENHYYTSSEIDRAFDYTIDREIGNMKGFLDAIWNIASIAPMIGLFGTVTGISRSFAEISKFSSDKAQADLIATLAKGINEALYTTIWGLSIGILTMLIYYLFKWYQDSTAVKWERIFVDLSNNF